MSIVNLWENIKLIIDENCDGTNEVFCDFFSGTEAVAGYFKPYYQIISNDINADFDKNGIDNLKITPSPIGKGVVFLLRYGVYFLISLMKLPMESLRLTTT